MSPSTQPHRVVIVGGGFAGLRAVRGLRRAPVEVILLDRRNHHLFQPLLYQVATGSLGPGEIAPPLRGVLRRQRNVRVLLAEVTSIDLDAGTVRATDDAGRVFDQHYDSLVVAVGARDAYFGHEEWRPFATGLKSIEDAIEIRNRVLRAFERAELEEDEAEREALLTFVVVGAGPTGVELAGQLAELARDTLRRDFRRIDPASATVLLLEGGDRALSTFDPRLSARTARSLASLGVELRTNTMVSSIDASGVLAAEARIAARTVIWAAGVRASPLGETMGLNKDVALDDAGRVVVKADLTLPGRPEVFVLGDMAALDLPAVAPVALQQGSHAARSIAGRARGRGEARPFRYRNRGSLATIGRYRAVAQIGRFGWGGLPAWILWLTIHIFYLVGFANRALVLLRWSLSFFTHGRSERVITRNRQLEDPRSRQPE